MSGETLFRARAHLRLPETRTRPARSVTSLEALADNLMVDLAFDEADAGLCVMIPGVAHRRQFKNLSEQEVLALAISSEEDDAQIYRWYAQRLRADYPQSAQLFDDMAREEDSHARRSLTNTAALWRGDSLDPPRARGRLLQPQAGVVDQEPRS
jgi:hypothetical protein